MACFCGGDKSAVEVTMEPPRFPGKNAIAPNSVRNNGSFEKIPKERIMYILFFLDPLSVCRFSRCSKSLKEIADDNRVWQWRLKPPERHEQNGSKENVDVPAKIQFLRSMAPTSLWFYVSAASKFMRNFSSQSSITALTQVLDRPNLEDTPYRKYLAERYLENEIVTMLLEDDEWKPPVIGCVATIMLGLQGRGNRYPALIQQLWQLVLDTEVADKIVPKLVVAAYFADPNFEKNAVEFVKNAVKFIQESGAVTTDEDEEKHASIASTMSYKSEDEKLGSRRTASVSSISHDGTGADSHSNPELPANPSPPKKRIPPKHLRRPSVKYVDVFCLTCALLTVVEMVKEFRKARTQVAALLPPEIVRLNDHHAYNRTAKSAKEWCQTIKDNTAALNLKKGKCVIM